VGLQQPHHQHYNAWVRQTWAPLLRFAHPTPATSHYSPHTWACPNYCAKKQFAPAEDTTAELPATDKTCIQEILLVLLFYGCAVDSTLVTALGTIALQQSTPTVKTMNSILQTLDYCATNPDAIINSDASCISAPKARSRAAGYHCISSHPKDPTKSPNPTDPSPPNDCAIHIMCNIMHKVLASTAKAELAAFFTMDAKLAHSKSHLKSLPQATYNSYCH
jgi:hypothetical protein